MTDPTRDRPPHKGYPGHSPEHWTCEHRPTVVIEVQHNVANRSLVQLIECSACGVRWTKRLTHADIEDMEWGACTRLRR